MATPGPLGESAPRCSLLGLPPELRLLIYDHVFQKTFVQIVCRNNEKIIFRNLRSSLRPRYAQSAPRHDGTGLLRTCRLIYAEALPIQCDRAHFHFITSFTDGLPHQDRVVELQEVMKRKVCHGQMVEAWVTMTAGYKTESAGLSAAFMSAIADAVCGNDSNFELKSCVIVVQADPMVRQELKNLAKEQLGLESHRGSCPDARRARFYHSLLEAFRECPRPHYYGKQLCKGYGCGLSK